ncbi:MAG: hypothetical protein CBC09_04085 [Cellvibrionales bacterium TMED49]|nr:NADH-quinone oxidoreductase subunit N [Porticoccaceae bacterium]OUU38997.1 MAG: hypothetical protein CBC09_04085 [Cellvibrionales bacterium TMED49]|tara:strand:+ start:3244 stop:4692 length:1449 start_codon:yes stop_codon:yes gene_type:complete
MKVIDFYSLAPILGLSVTIIVVMIQASIKRNHKLAWWISFLGVTATLWSTHLATSYPQQVTPLFLINPSGLWFSSLITVGALVTLILSTDDENTGFKVTEEYYLLLLLSTLGAVVLILASHMASLLLGMELLGISLYAMIAFPEKDPNPLEGAIKYLVLSAAASAMLLFGFALIYAATGDLSYTGIGAKLSSAGIKNPLLVVAGTSMLLASIGFKLSLAPFHMWTPDVYQGAPTPVTNFLATVSKGAMLVALSRFTIDGQLHQYPTFMLCLSVLAIISMLVGNWLALRQQQIKRLLAYSSIAHFGYLLVALVALRQLQESDEIFYSSLEAINFYLTAYIITSLAAFTVIANIGGENDPDMRSFAGLFWRKPVQASTLTVAMLSFAGIPLTAGFLGKFYLITLALNTNLWLLLITLVFGSAIAIYYYLRVIYTMLITSSSDNNYEVPLISSPMWRDALAIILMISVILLGTWPQPFIDFMRHL